MNTRRAICGVILLLTLPILIVGCGCKKSVMKEAQSRSVELVELHLDSTILVELKQDSLIHEWNIRKITKYHPNGMIESEEVEEHHREQSNRQEKTTTQNKAIGITESEEQGEEWGVDTKVDSATPAIKTTSNIKWIVIGVLCTVVVVFVAQIIKRVI